MGAIETLVNNQISLKERARYAAIIGESPSKGARSPALWNSAFKAFDKNYEMLSFDVSDENLEALLENLDVDEHFLGGAIAVPYKEKVAQWLMKENGGRLSEEALAIGAVNCLYRNESGFICGTNTDGEGALLSLKKAYGSLRNAKILLIGLGGAGKAVAAYVSSELNDKSFLTISSRSQKSTESFISSIGALSTCWPPMKKVINNVDILINCTVIGVGNYSEDTALAILDSSNEFNSIHILKELNKKSLVFDIIYDPNPTKLLELASANGISTLDGVEMNLLQAVTAFTYALPDSTSDLTESSMASVVAQFS